VIGPEVGAVGGEGEQEEEGGRGRGGEGEMERKGKKEERLIRGMRDGE
jgi:hypothetical protein